MSYTPVRPQKTWLMVQAVSRGGPLVFQYVPFVEEELGSLPREVRGSIIAGLMVWQQFSKLDQIEHLPHLLGWPEGHECDFGDLHNSQRNTQVNDTLKHLAELWPFEYEEVRHCIFDEETALMSMVVPPANQDGLQAFCPDGSKGFARYVGTTGLNNPRSQPTRKLARTDPTLVALFGRSVGKQLSQFMGATDEEKPRIHKDVEFPES